MKILNENPIHIIADEGMILTDGETYSTEVWLGKLDSPENWREILETDVPANDEALHGNLGNELFDLLKKHHVAGDAIAFITVPFTAKPCRVAKRQMLKFPNFP